MIAIGMFLTPGFQMLDLAGPSSAFECATSKTGSPAYRVLPVSLEGGPVRSSLGIDVATQRFDGQPIHTLMVAGSMPEVVPLCAASNMFAEAASLCERVASVCTGAFTLAAAGLLEGRRATTHWKYAARLQRDYPGIHVEPDRIYCRDGTVWTSAGITAGIDLALAMIEQDCGFSTAQSVAQHLVVYHRRLGGQSQFAASGQIQTQNGRIAAALAFARENISEPITVEMLADVAGMSLRQFGRSFRSETGTTPASAVERMRADLARGHIESSSEPIERIAEIVGFGDAERMRRALLRVFGLPPQSIRRVARIKP